VTKNKKTERETQREDTFRYLETNKRHKKIRKLTIIDRILKRRGNYYMKPFRLHHKQRSKEKWNEKNQTKFQKDSFRGVLSNN